MQGSFKVGTQGYFPTSAQESREEDEALIKGIVSAA
jgi:hypothetical protein